MAEGEIGVEHPHEDTVLPKTKEILERVNGLISRELVPKEVANELEKDIKEKLSRIQTNATQMGIDILDPYSKWRGTSLNIAQFQSDFSQLGVIQDVLKGIGDEKVAGDLNRLRSQAVLRGLQDRTFFSRSKS